jgi:HTH domain
MNTNQPAGKPQTLTSGCGCLPTGNHGLTVTTLSCHGCCMGTNSSRDETFQRIKEVRAEAIEHTRLARTLAVERRDLMQQLLDGGLSQADIARELGVSRQAIQKMMALA